MIDIHTHILPAVDDGAEMFADAVAILTAAAAGGTDSVVLTPHFPYRLFHDAHGKQQLLETERRFIAREEVAALGLTLYTGAENYCDSAWPELLVTDSVIPLNNTRYVLMEFPFGEHFEEVERRVAATVDCGYRPVLAHCERYACFQRVPERVRELKERYGVAIQVNAESFLGDNSHIALWLSDQLLRARLIDVVASDTHDIYERQPDLSEANAEVAVRSSLAYAELLFEENPGRILRDEALPATLG